MDLKTKITVIKDWPKPGASFGDLTMLLGDREAFRQAVDSLAGLFAKMDIDKVVGIDAGGQVLLAAPVAYKLNTGLAIARKKDIVPPSCFQQHYSAEFATISIEMNEKSLKTGDKIVVIDDLCATGRTALATCDLIKKLGGNILGIGFLIDKSFMGGSKKLKERGLSVMSIVEYDS